MTKANFHITTKPTGALCNIDCDYCFYLEKQNLYKGRDKKLGMSDDTLERYIIDYIDGQETDNVLFSWQGGEPTLIGLSFFKKAVALQKKHAKGKYISNTFQTNGLLIDEKWCAFLQQEAFLVGLSIDGPEHLHDVYRKTTSGKATFHKVMNCVSLFNQFNVEYNVLTVIHDKNIHHPIEVYTFLKSIGAKHIQFTPLVERKAVKPTPAGLTLISPDYTLQANVTSWSVNAIAYGTFLNTIFDEWIRNDIGDIFIQTFESTLSKMLGQEGNICVFEQTCGNALAMEANGDVYSCDHYVYPEHKLGNIHDNKLIDLATSSQQTIFGEAKKSNLSVECTNCPFLTVCNGGCPKHRFEMSSNALPNKNYFCDGYKAYFAHLTPYARLLGDAFQYGWDAAQVKMKAKLI